MGYKDHGAIFHYLADGINALGLKPYITYGKDLINQQDIRPHLSRDRKSKTDIHAGTIMLYRGIHKLNKFGKLYNFLKFIVYLFLAETKNGTVDIDILSPC